MTFGLSRLLAISAVGSFTHISRSVICIGEINFVIVVVVVAVAVVVVVVAVVVVVVPLFDCAVAFLLNLVIPFASLQRCLVFIST